MPVRVEHGSHLKAIQSNIKNLCGYNYEIENALFDLNIPTNQKYMNFLTFCFIKIREFASQHIQKQSSFFVDNLGNYDNLRSIERTYLTNFRDIDTSPDSPTDVMLHIINERIIDNNFEDQQYNLKTDQEIFEILKQRVIDMKKCKKEDEYYDRESQIESKILSKIDERKIPKMNWVNLENKNETIIGNISDQIKFGPKCLKAFDGDDRDIDKIIENILGKIKTLYLSDPFIIKRLMTFLPLELFIETSSPHNFIINEINFYNFLKRFGKSGLNFQQFKLGFKRDLTIDPSFDIPQLYFNYDIKINYYKPCGKYVDYNIYLNLFSLYIYGRSNIKVFPISFDLPTMTDHGVLDTETKSYFFRQTRTFNQDLLFSDRVEFLGIHLIKFRKQLTNGNYRERILPLFYFRDLDFSNENSSKLPVALSSYLGKGIKDFICNTKRYMVNEGEIEGTLNLTHHEIYNALYYGMRAYMLSDDLERNKRDTFYFTMKPRDNRELNILIRKLRMKEVYIVKRKFPNKNSLRLVILTDEEVRTYIEQRIDFQLMKNQMPPIGLEHYFNIPIRGGSKKINTKKSKKINTKKSKKINTKKSKKINTKKNKKINTKKSKKTFF